MEEAGQWSRQGPQVQPGRSGGWRQGVMCSAGPQEMVMLEIEVMNQLNHRNLIQLYAAIETSHDIILFME